MDKNQEEANFGYVEKESISETEGTHLHEDANEAILGSSTVDRRSGRRFYFYLLALVVAVVLIVTLPLVFVGRGSSSTVAAESANEWSSGSPASRGDSGGSNSNTSTMQSTASGGGGDDDGTCPGYLQLGMEYPEISRIFFGDMHLGQSYDRTFDVVPSYSTLSAGKGVVFNVETVPDALAQDASKPILDTADILQSIQDEAAKFYQADQGDVYPPPPLPQVNVEVASKTERLVFSGGQSFLAACMMAFAQHLPLALNAEHIWAIITLGFAHHVDQNSEELRYNFVSYDGKKEIKIREDSMIRGQSPPEQWEELIFPKFSQDIAASMNNTEVYDTLSTKFSTTTDITKATSEIVLMATMKNYFEYTIITACGIPKVQLAGTREDWVNLRDQAQSLAKWMMQNNTHGDLWINDIVLPILDQFIYAYDGDINYCFWQNMVKFRSTGAGSGSYDFLSGWLATLFPYLNPGNGKIQPNPDLRSWKQSASGDVRGPKPSYIPSQISSVAVKWVYYDVPYPIHFHAGFRGVKQDDDGTLQPVLGWYVTNDPNGNKTGGGPN